MKFNEMSDAELIDCLLYFKNVSCEAKQEILQKWQRIDIWYEGHIFCTPGSRSPAVVIVSGVADIRQAGSSLPIPWYVGAGSVIADDLLLGNMKSNLTATARTPCHVIELDQWYKTLAYKTMSVHQNILHQAQVRNAQREAYYSQFFQASKPERVILTVWNILKATELQIVDDDYALLPIEVGWLKSQEMIHELLGVSRPKVKEALQFLRHAGIIETGGNRPNRITLPFTLTKASRDIMNSLNDNCWHY